MTIMTGLVAPGLFDRQVPRREAPTISPQIGEGIALSLERRHIGLSWMAFLELGLCLDIRSPLEYAWTLIIVIC